MTLKVCKGAFLEFGKYFASEEGTALLYSGDSARFSYLCLFPSEKIVIKGENPWETLKREIALTGEPSDLPTWVGYLSYELGAFADPNRFLPHHPSPIPLAIFYKPTVILQFDSQREELTIHSKRSCQLRSKKIDSTFAMRCIKESSFEEYERNIAIAKEHIMQGNIYQINLSHQTLFEGTICPFSYFANVVNKNPAPYTAFLNTNDFSLICSSPERLLKKKGKDLSTSPIKGTHPRGSNAKEDEDLKNSLLSSSKERAELLMITDLMRNDLGKVSTIGSVRVDELYHLTAYQNVFHLSSFISSKANHLHPIDILRAVFPGGSISGCPKLRALELIYELEKRPRHIYTGSIGYLTNSGDFDFNISIRTCLYQNNILDIQLGAGIVYDSDPEKEYQETLAKGATLMGALI